MMKMVLAGFLIIFYSDAIAQSYQNNFESDQAYTARVQQETIQQQELITEQQRQAQLLQQQQMQQQNPQANGAYSIPVFK